MDEAHLEYYRKHVAEANTVPATELFELIGGSAVFENVATEEIQ